MPLHFNMVDPSRQMTTLINQEGEVVPIEMIIREGVFNGLDSNARYKHYNPDSDTESYILISKDFEHENKLRITNVGGDYFSEEVVVNNYLTLANTCEDNNNVNLGYDQTKGRGAKIAYLPQNPQGVLYRSRSDNGEGISFHVKTLDSGKYGLADFEDPDIGLTSFPFCDFYNKELNDSHGTDMVLLGAAAEQDTWNQLHIACGIGQCKASSVSGLNFLNYVSNRLWGPPPNPIKVQVYYSDPESDQYYQPKSIQTCVDLKTQISKRKVNGSFTLPKAPGVIDGTKVYFAHLSKEDKGYYTARNGFVGFAYKGEVYYDKNKDHNSHRADLKRCGIYTKATQWIIIFEIPDSQKLYSSGDRTQLKEIDLNIYFDLLKENLPEEIKQFLEENTQSDLNSSDLKKWLRDELSCFRMPQGTSSKSSPPAPLQYPNAPAPTSGNQSTGGSNNTSKGSQTRRQKIKSASSRLKCAELPEIITLNDEDSEFFRFSFEDYTLYFNTAHKVFNFRLNRFLNQFDKLTEKEIQNEVKSHCIKGALYRIFEVQQVYENESIQNKKELWAPKILESLWSDDTNKRLENLFKRRQNYRSAA